MAIHIIGEVDQHRLHCTGSFTKFVTTFVCLSFLAEKFKLENVIDDLEFLDKIALTSESKDFLTLFQSMLGDKFSIHDLCSYYSGLPYTFDLAEAELEHVELGYPFKHHSILDEKTFLDRCKNNITPVYKPRSKFHYSELSIIFLGYFIEKSYDVRMEDLYARFVIERFHLKHSFFSRTLVDNVYIQDLSDKFDYPAIAITNHGYFCYSNGFYTTLHDTKILIKNLLRDPVFELMVNEKYWRAASHRLMNGFAVEVRKEPDDSIYGYEGLSFSGCNIWDYSTKYKQGYITFTNDEDEAYDILYEKILHYHVFEKVPEYSESIYRDFVKNYYFDNKKVEIPIEFQGFYHRVKINEKVLNVKFYVGKDYIIIRNPEIIRYDVIYYKNNYRIKGKDGIHGARVGFYTAKSGNRYMFFDGNLYKKIS